MNRVGVVSGTDKQAPDFAIEKAAPHCVVRPIKRQTTKNEVLKFYWLRYTVALIPIRAGRAQLALSEKQAL